LRTIAPVKCGAIVLAILKSIIHNDLSHDEHHTESTMSESKKSEAIYMAECRGDSDIEIQVMKDSPASDFSDYNACASPKESTEKY
jgi:hypothetical protein